MTTRVTSSRLVGRTTELAQLEAALADASQERPSLAFVAGDSGVGKTRLLDELTHRARQDGARVLVGEAVELGEGELPYAALVGALRPLARSGDPALDALDPRARAELARLLPGLAGTGGEGGHGGAETEGAAQARLFEAVLALLDRLGEDAPVLLALEDIHWADPSTRAFIAFMARALCRERVLVVATYRLDELHRRHPLRPLLAELERDTNVHRVVVPALTRDEVADALEDILGEPPDTGMVDRLFARSEGNPLYMEELVAAGTIALPETLRDALMVRVERLGEDAQELLRVLAVATRADHALLTGVSGLDPAALRAALRDAVASHIVVTDEEDRYAFRHALLREVVEADLLPGEQTELHLQLARALEERPPDALVAAGIAHHYAAAGDQPAALAAAVRAATAANELHAHGEAAALLERALELWNHVPDAAALAGADRVDVLLRAATQHGIGGDQTRVESLLKSALEQVDEPRRRAVILERLARAQWRLNRPEDAMATARQALELLSEDDPERATLLGWWAKTRMLQGRYSDAVHLARETLAAAEAAGNDVARANALNALGVSLAGQGHVDEGVAKLREAQEIARAAGNSDALESASNNLADHLNLAGRTEEALEVARAAFREERERWRDAAVWTELMVVEIATDAGLWEEARSLMPANDRSMVGLRAINASLRKADLALGMGDHATAADRLLRIDRLVADSAEPQFHGTLGALLAELRRRQGDLDGARAAVDEALDRIEFCTEDTARLARVSAAGVTVEADRAQRGRDLNDAEEVRRALLQAEGLLMRVQAAAEPEGPVECAYLAQAEAAMSRAQGEADPALAVKAAEAWEAIKRPYPAAEARWRAAEAHVARGERDAAAPLAAAALETAKRLGAGWLAGEVEGLIARARLGSSEAAAPAEDGDDPFGLTPRERQVLSLVAAGKTNREIGASLYMAEKTASVHVSRILAKLDVRSRTEAAAVAHRLGLTD